MQYRGKYYVKGYVAFILFVAGFFLGLAFFLFVILGW